jgi:hypothetical protein
MKGVVWRFNRRTKRTCHLLSDGYSIEEKEILILTEAIKEWK